MWRKGKHILEKSLSKNPEVFNLNCKYQYESVRYVYMTTPVPMSTFTTQIVIFEIPFLTKINQTFLEKINSRSEAENTADEPGIPHHT